MASCCPTVIPELPEMSRIQSSWASADGQISNSSSTAGTCLVKTASTAYGLYQLHHQGNFCIQSCPALTQITSWNKPCPRKQDRFRPSLRDRPPEHRSKPSCPSVQTFVSNTTRS